MVLGKRTYAPQRSASRPAKTRAVSVRRQLFKLKETKHANSLLSVTEAGAFVTTGAYGQVISDYRSVDDALQSDTGMLTRMDIAIGCSNSTAIPAHVRVLIIKDKNNAALSATSLLWQDPNQSNGQAGTSSEVSALEQIFCPINTDGHVVKFDRMFALGGTGNGAPIASAKASVALKEKITQFNDLTSHSANYYVCAFACERDGTAATINLDVMVTMHFKDLV